MKIIRNVRLQLGRETRDEEAGVRRNRTGDLVGAERTAEQATYVDLARAR